MPQIDDYFTSKVKLIIHFMLKEHLLYFKSVSNSIGWMSVLEILYQKSVRDIHEINF